MHDVTLALAVILGSGFFIGKLGQLARLPSVIGYILADLILGLSVLNFVSEETITGKLGHFTQIALMLIAFRIGEHLEISRPKRSLKSVGLIAISETSGAFLFVILVFFVAQPLGVGESGWALQGYVVLALLFGVVSVATDPAATLHVMRELKAAGKLKRELTQKVADEVESLGYRTDLKTVTHEDVAKGILSAAIPQKTWAIILGHPRISTS
jgi:Kef-type K+ transport system membrane component KefB